jgi:voltage-gated potassium channel
MKDHMVVCGAGATGRHIITELFHARMPVVAIDTNEAVFASLRQHHPGARFEYIAGDATDDEVLARARIDEARAVAATVPSDKDNLYIVVATRQSNARARIVSRVTELSHADKLRRVGADAVVAMSYIGGRRMASEMSSPVLVRFLDDMLKDTRAAYRLCEVTIEPGSQLAGLTLGDATIRERFGISVLAIGDGERSWQYNPDDREPLAPGSVVIVLGSTEQVEPLLAYAASPS